MALGIASWDPENPPGRAEGHFGRARALPAPRKALAYVRAAANCAPRAAAPVTQLTTFHGQPTSPQALENSSSTLPLVPGALFLHGPTRLAGSADTRWPAATAAGPEKMNARLRSLPTSTRFLMGLRSRPTSTRFSQHIAMPSLKPSCCFKYNLRNRSFGRTGDRKSVIGSDFRFQN